MSKTVELNEIVQLTYDLRYGGQSDVVGQLKNIAEKLMEVLRYKTATISKLAISGYFNKYIKEDITVNLYREHASGYAIVNKDNILNVIESYRMKENNHFMELLILLNVLESQYDSIAGYAEIVNQLRTFLTHFVELHSHSKLQMMEFLNKNFNNELKQLSNIQLQLEEEDLYLDDNLIAQISRALGRSYMPSYSVTSEGVYGLQNTPSVETDDVNFKDLFYLFLQIAGANIVPGQHERDFSKIIELMLNIYMERSGVQWYELCDYTTLELKINALYEFLVTEDDVIQNAYSKLLEMYDFYPDMVTSAENLQESMLLHSAMQKLNIRLESTAINDLPASSSAHNRSFDMAKADQIELIINIQRLVPQLNDFNFNFDEHFDLALQMFISLLNSELATSNDISFIRDIVQLINSIVDFENDEEANNGGNIYQTALHLYELHKLISPDYIGNNPKATLLMRMSAIDVKRTLGEKDRVLKAWNRRILQLSQLNYSLNNTWKVYSTEKSLSAVFSIWRRISLTNYSKEMAAADYYNKSLLVKLILSKWIPKVQEVQVLHQKAKNTECRRIFKKWKTKKSTLSNHLQIATQKNSQLITRKAFSLMKQSYTHIQQLQHQSSQFEKFHQSKMNKLVLQMTFINWYESMDKIDGMEQLIDKLHRLSLVERKVVLKSFFQRLKRNLELKTKEKQVVQNNNEYLILYFFHKWEHLYKLKYIAEDFEFTRDTKHKENSFMHWRYLTKLQHMATQSRNNKLLRTTFNQWKLSSIAKKFATKDSIMKNLKPHTEFVSNQLKINFKNWRLAMRSKELKQYHNNTQSKIFLDQWVNRIHKINQMKQLASNASKSGCARKYLSTWNNVYHFQNHLPEIANDFYLKKFWFTFKNKYNFKNKLLEIETTLTKDSIYKVNDATLLRYIIRLWKSKKESRFNLIADQKIAHFQRGMYKAHLQHRYFLDWVYAYNNSTYKTAALYERLRIFNEKSNYRRFFFNKWRTKTRKAIELEEQADDFEYTLLHKKYMVIWYDKFVNKTQFLNELAQELIDQRELRLQREMLSNWSMKYIKFITSSQQSCTLFVKRWESSRVKSIFDLWLYKLESRQLEDKMDVTIEDDFIQKDSKNVFLDTSTDSIFNDSPLALKKRPASKATERENTSPVVESYLTSPIKSKNSSPATPITTNVKNSSPSRLQTSLRMKSERIQAVRDRYKKARDTKSVPTTQKKTSTSIRVKPYSFLSNDVIISPPKRPEFHSTPIKPVNTQPNFEEDYIKSEPRFSPGYLSKFNSSSSSTFHDISRPKSPIITRKETNSKDIEDAKKLKRITPIVIPMTDEDEPKISPIRTIKQRNSMY